MRKNYPILESDLKQELSMRFKILRNYFRFMQTNIILTRKTLFPEKVTERVFNREDIRNWKVIKQGLKVMQNT